jgi:hypothetical protein
MECRAACLRTWCSHYGVLNACVAIQNPSWSLCVCTQWTGARACLLTLCLPAASQVSHVAGFVLRMRLGATLERQQACAQRSDSTVTCSLLPGYSAPAGFCSQPCSTRTHAYKSFAYRYNVMLMSYLHCCRCFRGGQSNWQPHSSMPGLPHNQYSSSTAAAAQAAVQGAWHGPLRLLEPHQEPVACSSLRHLLQCFSVCVAEAQPQCAVFGRLQPGWHRQWRCEPDQQRTAWTPISQQPAPDPCAGGLWSALASSTAMCSNVGGWSLSRPLSQHEHCSAVDADVAMRSSCTLHMYTSTGPVAPIWFATCPLHYS